MKFNLIPLPTFGLFLLVMIIIKNVISTNSSSPSRSFTKLELDAQFEQFKVLFNKINLIK